MSDVSGFCGVVGLEDKTLIRRMNRIMFHRGLDGEGYYIDNNIMLGHLLLRLEESRKTSQPIFNEDHSLCLVSSGRILNYPTLKKELEKKGHIFSTDCDAEVILHSYEEFNTDFMTKLNGPFAFALWDSKEKRLLLARDRNGIEPLYYCTYSAGADCFLFASEIKSILQYEKVKRKLDLEAFHLYVNLRYVPLEKTLFKGIKRLLPAHYAILDQKGFRQTKYFNFKYHPEEKPLEDYIKELRFSLERAVKMHFTPEAGFLLSGGIDSSTLVAIASKLSSAPIKTFTMGFGQETDETEDANRVAEYFDTDHRNLIVKTHLLRDYPQMIWYADLPKRNLYPYYIYQLAGRRSKLILNALGLDELLGGYPWKYEYARSVEKIRERIGGHERDKLSASAGNIISFHVKDGEIEDDRYLEILKKFYYINDDVDLYLEITSLDEVFSNYYLPKIYGKKMKAFSREDVKKLFSSFFEGGNLMRQFMSVDYQVKAVDDFLFTEKTMSAAHSVESRMPFLENSLVDLAFKIPAEMKIKGGEGKYILKKAVKPFMPKMVLEKKKMGFGSDPYITYIDEIYELAKQRLPEGNIVQNELIKKSYVDQILTHNATPNLVKHYCLFWSLLVFEIWYEIFIKKEKLEKPTKGIDSILSP